MLAAMLSPGLVPGFSANLLAFLTPSDFLLATKWSLGFTGLFAVLAAIAFALKWGFRFRLVGVTGFMVVLTVGLFSLSLFPIIKSVVPGAAPYTLVYDNGGGRAVVTVPQDINESQLEATLRQAALDRFSPGRLGQSLSVRARTLLHPEEGVTEPLYLGRVRRSQSIADEDAFDIQVDREALARLSDYRTTTEDRG